MSDSDNPDKTEVGLRPPITTWPWMTAKTCYSGTALLGCVGFILLDTRIVYLVVNLSPAIRAPMQSADAPIARTVRDSLKTNHPDKNKKRACEGLHSDIWPLGLKAYESRAWMCSPGDSHVSHASIRT